MNFDSSIYGNGVIRSTVTPNLNILPMFDEQGGEKEVIYKKDNIKVDPKIGKNYYKDYMNQTVSKMNNEERKQINFEESVRYLEEMENSNLDFDGDGKPDFDMSGGVKINNSKSIEVQEEIQKPADIDEKSTVKAEVEKPDIENTAELDHIDDKKSSGLDENKDKPMNTIDTQKGTVMSINDMINMGSGAIALGAILLGRNLKQ
tara:strand:- start:534 stop:1145 length:612 start_codon:yes stop_codon:yes gene_type:complete